MSVLKDIIIANFYALYGHTHTHTHTHTQIGEMGVEQELLKPKSHAGDSTKNPVQWDSKKDLTKDIIIANFEALGLNGAVFTAGKSGKMPYGQIKKYFRGNDVVINPGTPASTTTQKTEDLQFYYNPDHLGSSNYITDASGEVYQHQEYFPFGETFVEERNDAEYTTYLFNGKELDEETGLYYYGARYYDPRISMFYGVDPVAEKAPGWSPYRAFFNNPILFIDPDGQWEEDANGNLVAEKGDQAWSLAKYLNTSPEMAIKMLGEQGYTVNKKGILNLNVGDVFEIEHQSETPKSREDLKGLGNKIRDRAGSEFSKNLFENYWKGEGDVELSGKRFAGVLMYAKENELKISSSSDVKFKGFSALGSKKAVNFYSSSEYEKAFGTATLYFNSRGNIIGLYDYYDFDPKDWGQRSTKAEVITRMVNYASPKNAKPFSIRYGYSKR